MTQQKNQKPAPLAAAGMALATVFGAFIGSAQAAEPVLGRSYNWQMGMQAPVTSVKDFIDSFHNELLIIITAITIFVLALLIYVMVRFRASNNPVPSRTSHNTLIEIIWTFVPILILMVVAIPSFKLLYFEDRQVDADMTVKVTGHQWYWSYEYPDNGNFGFDSLMTQDADLKNKELRLLEVDNHLVVPVNATVRIQLASVDVLHAWMIPSFGVQRTAVPGRLNETWFKAEHEGTFYGQCTELCGENHAYMPIAIDVVSKPVFDKWVADAKKKFAAVDAVPVRVAAASMAQQ